MKNLYSLYLLILAVLFVSCEKSQEEKLIANYEQTIGDAKMDLNFNLKNLEKVRDITAQDSLDILKPTFEKNKKERLERLGAELEEEKIEILRAKAELEDAKENEPYLVETLKSSLEYRQDLLEGSKKSIELFETDCKGTFLEPVHNSIQRYEETPDKLLATEYNVTYSIENPMLNNTKQEISKTYLLNSDRTKVLSTN